MMLHAQWMNSTLRQMWPYYDAAVCATVKARAQIRPLFLLSRVLLNRQFSMMHTIILARILILRSCATVVACSSSETLNLNSFGGFELGLTAMWSLRRRRWSRSWTCTSRQG